MPHVAACHRPQTRKCLTRNELSESDVLMVNTHHSDQVWLHAGYIRLTHSSARAPPAPLALVCVCVCEPCLCVLYYLT